VLKQADQALDKAKEQETAERHLRSLESRRDTLVSTAEKVHDEVRFEDGLLAMNEDIQRLSQLLLDLVTRKWVEGCMRHWKRLTRPHTGASTN
jgi:hypothetical protein